MENKNGKRHDKIMACSSNSNIFRLTIVAVFLALISSILMTSTVFDSDADTSGECGDGLTWNYANQTLTISKSSEGTGAMRNYTLSNASPWSGLTFKNVTVGDGVTSIGDYAFKDCTDMTSIIMSDSVTSIGGHVFEDCGLRSVNVPDSVTVMGDYVFNNCSYLASVTIGRGVTTISYEAFKDCSSLTSIIMSDSITNIGREAFKDCVTLTSIDIPDSVITIGKEAFEGCIALTSVTLGNGVASIGDGAFTKVWKSSFIVEDGNRHYKVINGCLCTYDEKTLLCAPFNEVSIIMPGSVTSIGNYAFNNCSNLTSVTIPNGITSIGERAFFMCTSLTSVTIPNSVISIGDYAFLGCSGLTSVTIPNSVTDLGDGSFSSCTALISVIVSNNVREMSPSVFYNCSNLKSITIPNGVTSIGERAFSGCSILTPIIIPNSVTSIGADAFNGCSNLKSITIPNSVIAIGADAFAGCRLTGLVLTSTGSDSNKLMSNVNVWSENRLPGMTSAFERIIIEGDVDLNGLSPDDGSDLELIFAKDVNVTHSSESGSVAIVDIRSDDELAGSVYKYSGGKWVESSSIHGYTVVLNANGGSCTSSVVVSSNSPITLPIPVKKGYTFDGWYDSSDVRVSRDSYIASENTTLNAKYVQKSFTITYDSNHGTGEMDPKNVDYVDLCNNTKTLETCTFNPPAGKVFVGWSIGLSVLYSENAAISDKDIDGNVTVYAVWTSVITVTFDANGGSVNQTNKIVTYGDRYGPLPTPTKDGYTFDGWYFNGTMVTSSTIVTKIENHTLVASWSSIPTHHFGHDVNVTFDSNGGSSVDGITVKYGYNYGYLPTPTKERCIFDGWYFNGMKITAQSIVDTHDDHILTARWSYPIDANVIGDPQDNSSLIIVAAACALLMMMLLILAYVRRRKDEE